jgi:hypothetical protein
MREKCGRVGSADISVGGLRFLSRVMSERARSDTVRAPSAVMPCRRGSHIVARLYFLAAGMLSSIPTAFSGQVTGVVSTIVARASDGLTYVYVNATATGRPSCAAGTAYWIIRDENSEAGKKQYAMLLTAKSTGAIVTIVGMNTCVRWGDGEDIDWIQVAN